MHTPDSPLKECIVHTDEIVRLYDQANISFDVFAQLLYRRVQPALSYGTADRICAQPATQNISYAKLPLKHLPCRLLTAVSPSRPHVLCLLSFFLRAVYHRLHCIYQAHYPDRGWHHLLWYNAAKEKQLEERQNCSRSKREGTVRISRLLHRDSARSAYPFDTDQRSSKPLRKWRYRSPR